MDDEVLKKYYYQLYTDCWKFFRNHCNPINNDEWWDNAINDANDIIEKYNTDFARKLVMQSVEEIEKIQKESG